jgi:hypothetical protein
MTARVAFRLYCDTTAGDAPGDRRTPEHGAVTSEEIVLLPSVPVPGPSRPVTWAKASAPRRRRSVIVRSILEVAASQEAEIPAIGTLNEGALHAQLKDWYQRVGAGNSNAAVPGRVQRIVVGLIGRVGGGGGSFPGRGRRLSLLVASAAA